MSIPARDLTLGEARFRLVLPGTWAEVPLGDPPRARAHVARLVRERVGRADRLARLRREAVNDLLATADQAHEVGAHTFVLALELLPGVPFPAALLALDSAWPEEVLTRIGADGVEAALREVFPEREIVTTAAGPIARLAEVTRDAVGEAEYQTLHLEYVLPDPSGGLLVLRVNVPTVPDPGLIATLFDEVVDSLRWTPRAPTTVAASS